MFSIFSRSILILVFIAFVVAYADAQSDATTRGGVPPKDDYSTGIQESLAKQRIEREKKDFAELLSRGEETVKISDELEKSFAQNNQLSVEDRKKLDRLEKLVKKIRAEIGGSDDDDDDESVELDNKPLSVGNALKSLQNNTSKLVGELKKTTRHTVSVVAVESSNLLLRVVRFLRVGKS
ncbi:MAG: hypothetical protein LH614_21725 [Pyrinomonadaceae bacterium]|nr:hypothetical protein [Pyrinomonadaceae bacterium]